MSIVRQAINALISPTVNAALSPLQERIAALEAAPAPELVLSPEDRAAIDKAAQLVAEFEALAGGVETVTVPEIK
jgi:hypothetical protein